MSDLRVGVLGCGQVSPDHFVAWSRARGARVVAVCDPARERAEARAREYGIEAVFTEPQEMFGGAGLDAVDVITPRETHAGMVRLAARHGLHVLCEKPLCPTHAEAAALVEEVGDSVRVMVNENWRYREYFRIVRDWIAAGRLGRLVHLRIALVRSNMLRNEAGEVPALLRQPFMAREARLLIAESLIHEVDTVRSIVGDYAVVAARIARASDAVAGEDVAVILGETADGLSLVLEGVLAAAGHPVRAGDRLEIAGTRASVLLDGGRLSLLGPDPETLDFDEALVRQECFDRSIQHFVDGLATGAPFATSARDQLGTLKVVEDAYAAAGAIRPR